MISVVIVTKNRAQALEEISLPSLLSQDCSDFEVVVWDASDHDRSRSVVASFVGKFEERGVCLRFFSAPRQGSASQRNDAVPAAQGEILFFIDDDSEVSPDGIKGLRECFHSQPSVMGAGLSMVEIHDCDNRLVSPKETLKEILYRLIGYRRRRQVSLSGSAKGISAPTGPAEWLSGCSMAFRREVFDRLAFDEKLETFGPYAMFEDILFSHQVFLLYARPLLVASRGFLVHRPVAGERVEGTDVKTAMFFYNRYRVMKVASINHPCLGYISYTWACLRLLLKLSRRYGAGITRRGFLLAMRQILSDRKE